jgi:hypothetical protein
VEENLQAAEWNTAPARRRTIKSRRLFSASIAELTTYGLTPVFTTDDMPSKLAYGVGLVVAATGGKQ